MNRTKSLDRATFVVPCFNEEERLEADQIAAFLGQVGYLHVIFVDDGSSDQTLDVLLKIRSKVDGDRITVLSLAENCGKAEAIRQGVLHSLTRGYQASHPGQLVGYFDADLATPLDQLNRLVDVATRLEHVDVIFGCRLSLSGHQVDRTPGRRVLGRLFSFVASRSVGVSLVDTQCGAKLFRVNECLEKIFRQPFSSRWFFDVEILARMRSILGAGYVTKVFELPLESWQEIGGSKLKTANFLQAPWELIRIFTRYRLRFWDSLATHDEEIRALVMEDSQPLILPFQQRTVSPIGEEKAA